MSEPFLAEVRMVGFTFAPRGWALCDGQILPINQNQSLYSLLGTTYGGDGRTSFALPDLRGRVPTHDDTNQGQKGGAQTVALNTAQIPNHGHGGLGASNANGSTVIPANGMLGGYPDGYLNAAPDKELASTGSTGFRAGHNNMQPYLVINFCIAIQGVFPSRN